MEHGEPSDGVGAAAKRELATEALWEVLDGFKTDAFMALAGRERLGLAEFDAGAARMWTPFARAALAVEMGADLATERGGSFPALSAAGKRDARLLALLAGAGAPLAAEGNFKGGCVRIAAKMCALDVLGVALAGGAAPDERPGPSSATALTMACRGMLDHKAEACARALLDAGADVEARVEPEGITPLIAAARSGNAAVCDLLVARGAKIDARLASGADAAGEARDAGYADLAGKLDALNEARILGRRTEPAPSRPRPAL